MTLLKSKNEQAQQEIVGLFSRAADSYDSIGPRFFSQLGRHFVDVAELGVGSRVLDVAAGRGAFLFAAADKVGPQGRVIGIDLAANMVNKTCEDIHRRKLKNTQMLQMSAQALDFPDASFDWVLCGFALWFFPQPQQALREMWRVLKPGGRVVLTTWAKNCPFITWIRKALDDSLQALGMPPPALAPTLSFNTVKTLGCALTKSGFGHIDIKTSDHDFIYTDTQQWWQSLWSHGIRSRFEQLDVQQVDIVKADLLRRAQELMQPDGLHTLFQVLLAQAVKPL